jgi:hypothetical protein
LRLPLQWIDLHCCRNSTRFGFGAIDVRTDRTSLADYVDHYPVQ